MKFPFFFLIDLLSAAGLVRARSRAASRALCVGAAAAPLRKLKMQNWFGMQRTVNQGPGPLPGRPSRRGGMTPVRADPFCSQTHGQRAKTPKTC